jgi:hypothetical protein
MGHKSDSKIFSAYQSKVSDIHLQAIYRAQQEQDMVKLMSISLNRKEDAPTRVSQAGLDEILADPAVVALEKARSDNFTALTTEHGSLAAAGRASDPRMEDYRSAYNEHKELVESLMRKKFAEEYKDFFATASCPQLDAPSQVETLTTNKDTSSAPVQLQIPISAHNNHNNCEQNRFILSISCSYFDSKMGRFVIFP